MSDFRIYVACLASYNNGVLHGTWIDCDGKESEDIATECAAMLRASPYPNATVSDYQASAIAAGWTRNEHNGMFVAPVGHDPRMTDSDNWQELCEEFAIPLGNVPSAEEWAIHDNEGFGRLINEYTSFETVANITEALSGDHAAAFRYLVEDRGATTSEAAEQCESVIMIGPFYAFELERESADYVQETLEDCGQLEGVSDSIVGYINWNGMAADWLLSGDIAHYEPEGDDGQCCWIVCNASEF